ncbi:hypothetical protein CORC01_12691 [Colletotrichum orchidophilum]|uniref:Uncharacterized protein n=1 Tax=Colletotrichum orchidophilum TaxID=1209926 RepID=A0A1G4AS68_9PEZI|nr:uncharacterized protein CORC01_12691 [Colletotrichum orchidophilum]OHE92000.1 hypothetical protein CORC01_12691 [Colletotrichum orchidophilum]
MDFLRSHSRKGRSRFSKALPTPPSPKAEPIPKSKQLPSIPSVPPVPSKKAFAMSDKPLPPPQPLNQSLPPLPPLETKALPPVHIPRRPVAKQPSPPSASANQQQQQQQSYSPQDERNSIGSLLSAYSRSSGESLMSPDGSASQRDSTQAYASEQYGTRENKILTPTSLSSGDNDHYGAQKFTPNKGLPPHPAYYNKQAGSGPINSAPAPTAGSPTSAESTASPQQQQRPLWRRRSVKSDRNIEVPDLHLTASHGSTAASQPNTAQTSYSATPPPAQQQQFPPRSTSNLPGRNIRPVPAQSQTAQTNNMGQEVSRLKEKIHHLRDGQDGANMVASHSDTALSPTQRLPTPDYAKEDVKTPVVETIVSPVSPASSPEPGRDQANESKPSIPRKAVTEQNLHNAQSLPQMRVDGPVTSNDAPPTITRDFAVNPVNPDPRNQLPPRAASIKQRQQQQQQREYVPYAPAPGFAQGDTRPASRDQRPNQEPVEYRELKVKDLPPADPRASFFPMQGSEPPSPGMIYKALPLKESMLDCYVKHRTMDRTRNRNYALTCQTCGKADTEDRYKCQFCYVRMCGSCLQIFNSNQRDLRKLMAHLEGNPQSGGSRERPATAAGIEAPQKEEQRTDEQQQYHQSVAA